MSKDLTHKIPITCVALEANTSMRLQPKFNFTEICMYQTTIIAAVSVHHILFNLMLPNAHLSTINTILSANVKDQTAALQSVTNSQNTSSNSVRRKPKHKNTLLFTVHI